MRAGNDEMSTGYSFIADSARALISSVKTWTKQLTSNKQKARHKISNELQTFTPHPPPKKPRLLRNAKALFATQIVYTAHKLVFSKRYINQNYWRMARILKLAYLMRRSWRRAAKA